MPDDPTLDEIEVLIDQLDDPIRRWFIARELQKRIRDRGPSLTLSKALPDHLWQRILDIAGEPDRQYSDGLRYADVHTRAIRRLSQLSEPQSLHSSREVAQVWSVAGVVFGNEEAARAYSEFLISQGED